MNLNELLSQLGVGSRETVYMSVTPGVGLELIQLDVSAKTVKNYAYRPLEYNDSLREITNIEAFKSAVQELFAELKINIKCNVILNMPMVLFGSTELTLLLADDAVTEALTSEVEQSYIFKRYEPLVSWVDVSNGQSGDMRKLFYSAIQKNVVEEIKKALAELGANLVSVEVSLTSILKALAFSGLIENQLKEGVSWNLMLVSQNGYSICSMIGKNVIDYYEEPLAIKSFEGDEIYNAINASTQIALMSYPANYLYIVSETDMVSAELLSRELHFDGSIDFIENNDFKKNEVLPVSLEVLESTAHKISLEAIGIATGKTINLPIKFNFANNKNSDSVIEDPNEPVHVALGSYEFDISPNFARNIAFVLAVLLLIPALFIFISVPLLVKNKQARLDDVNAKLQGVETKIKMLEEEQNKFKDFDVNSEIKRVLSCNRAKLMAYTAVGESVPKSLWLTYFVAKDDGKFDIKGEANNVEDVYAFYKNMKDSLLNTKLRLHKLEMISQSVDDAVAADVNNSAEYEFEITNMTAAELDPQPVTQTPEVKTTEDKNGLLNKPLLNFGKK